MKQFWRRHGSELARSERELRLDREDWLACAAIAVIAVIPRLLLMLSLPPLVHPDSDSYFTIAESLWAREGFGDLSRRLPLYPLFLWVTARYSQVGLTLTVVVQHLLGVGTAVLIYWMARKMFAHHRLPAMLCGLAAGLSIYPAMLEQAVLSETLYTFLIAAATCSLIAWMDEERWWLTAITGGLLAMSAMTRPIGVGLFIVWTLVVFLLKGRKEALRFAVMAGAVFAALLLPMLVRNYHEAGQFGLGQSAGRNLISVADRFVDFEKSKLARIRTVYREYMQDKRGPDAVVVYAAMPKLRRETGWSDERIDAALAEIAMEGIREHPAEFLWSRLRRWPLLYRDPGTSQSYALHGETYWPLVELQGQINPEMVSRSLTVTGMDGVRFAMAERIHRVLGVDLTGGWMMLLVLLGMVLALRSETRMVAAMCGGLLVYHGLGTILMQPPNARYRVATLPWEILFAVAGVWITGQYLLGKVQRNSLEWLKVAPKRAIAVSVAAALMLTGGRLLLEMPTKTVISAGDFTSSQRESGDQGEIVQNLRIWGRKQRVLYWDGEELLSEGIARAETAIQGGVTYMLDAAISCQQAACGGASGEIQFTGGGGEKLGSTRFSFTSERIDNDAFWDPVVHRFQVPAAATQMAAEIRFQGGLGNVVIPLLEIRPAPRIFNVWRLGNYGKIAASIIWLGIAGIALAVLRKRRRE